MQNYTVIIAHPYYDRDEFAKEISKIMGCPIVDTIKVIQERAKYQDDLGQFVNDHQGKTILGLIAEDIIADTIKWRRGGSFVTTGIPSFPERAGYLSKIFEGCKVCLIHLCGISKEKLFEKKNDLEQEEFDDLYEYYEKMIASVRQLYGDKVIDIDVTQDVDLKEILNFEQLPPYIPLPHEKERIEEFGNNCIPSSAIEGATVIQSCLRLAESQQKLFPGTHPVHVTREMLETNLKKFPYLVSKKVDGTRYLMVIDGHTIWFLNRRFDVWKGPSSIYLKKFSQSLIDVEVRKQVVTVIDVISINKQSVRGMPLFRRLGMARGLVAAMEGSPLKIRMQHYYEMNELSKIVSEYKEAPQFDGLIFTPKKTSYRLGRNNNLLKWKPAGTNTGDFIYDSGLKKIFCQGMNNYVCCGEVTGVPDEIQNGTIIECNINIENMKWIYYRERKDKENPNTESVIENIVQSARDSIGISELCG